MLTLGLVLLAVSALFGIIERVCKAIEESGIPEPQPRQVMNVNVDKMLVVNGGRHELD